MYILHFDIRSTHPYNSINLLTKCHTPLFTPSVLSFCSLLLSSPSVLSFCPLLLFTPSVLSFCPLLLSSPSVHSFCPLLLSSPSVLSFCSPSPHCSLLIMKSISSTGDFSVMCRFGGHHAMTRDKTTLIFKYQNNTGTYVRTCILYSFSDPESLHMNIGL